MFAFLSVSNCHRQHRLPPPQASLIRESERAASYEASRQSQRVAELEAAAAASRLAEQNRAATSAEQVRRSAAEARESAERAAEAEDRAEKANAAKAAAVKDAADARAAAEAAAATATAAARVLETKVSSLERRLALAEEEAEDSVRSLRAELARERQRTSALEARKSPRVALSRSHSVYNRLFLSMREARRMLTPQAPKPASLFLPLCPSLLFFQAALAQSDAAAAAAATAESDSRRELHESRAANSRLERDILSVSSATCGRVADLEASLKVLREQASANAAEVAAAQRSRAQAESIAVLRAKLEAAEARAARAEAATMDGIAAAARTEARLMFFFFFFFFPPVKPYILVPSSFCLLPVHPYILRLRMPTLRNPKPPPCLSQSHVRSSRASSARGAHS